MKEGRKVMDFRNKFTLTLIILVIPFFFSTDLHCKENLILNGDFSKIDSMGKPKHWGFSFGKKGSKVIYSIADGPSPKKNALKLECSLFTGGRVILKQDNVLKVKKGRRIYISFWVKKENIQKPNINLHIMQIEPWTPLAKTTFPASEEWRKVELVINFGKDAEYTRFEIFFTEEGTLYLSDIIVEETDRSPLEFNAIRQNMIKRSKIPTEKNMVINSSFETGINDWGVEHLDHNIAEIDNTQSVHGKRSAMIDFNKDRVPYGYKEYSYVAMIKLNEIQFVTKDWIRLKEGETYTLSLFLKSNNPSQNVKIGMRYMTGQSDLKNYNVSSDWKRYSHSFKAKDTFGTIVISSSTSRDKGMLWIDAIQLEKGTQATEYKPRYPVEIGLMAKRKGNIYYSDEEIIIDLVKYFSTKNINVRIHTKFLNYREEVISEKKWQLTSDSNVIEIKAPFTKNGYYKLEALVSGKNFEYRIVMPFIIIFPYSEKYKDADAKFGINHQYYSDLCLDLSKEAGVGWIRNWSLKWNDVEPEKGRFDFSRQDIFLKRAQKHNFKTLFILPDPSSSWASTAPKNLKGKRLGDTYVDLWYLPKDMKDYKNYVTKCVTRYKDVSEVFEILNEPYKAKTQKWKIEDKYEEFLNIANEAIKETKKDIKIMRCGLGYLRKDNEKNISATRLSDITGEHGYPTYNDTKKFIKTVQNKKNFYTKNNLKQDLWWTEYGKYSHDEPHHRYARFDHFLANKDEKTASIYSLKYLTILFSHGFSKVFFHTRTWPLGVHIQPTGVYFDMLFKYDAIPMKFFPVCNAFSWLIPPGSSPGTPINEEGPIFSYSYKNKDKKILIFWTDKKNIKLEKELIADAKNIKLYDMMGGSIAKVGHATDEPVYISGEMKTIDAIEKYFKPSG